MNEDFITYESAKKLKEKGFDWQTFDWYDMAGNFCKGFMPRELMCREYYAPTISQVLKWLREEKNIDVEIESATGMLGIKVYLPYICTYTEFTLETSPDVVRYRQKKFNPTARLPHEIIPAHVHFKEWEQAALAGIEFVLDNLI